MAPAAPPPVLDDAIKTLHYTFPILVLIYFVFTLSLTVCTLQTQKLRIQDQRVRRDIIFVLIFVVSGTYLLETLNVLTRTYRTGWYAEQDYVVYLLASTINFVIQALALTDSKFPVWYPYYGTWLIGLLVEALLLVLPGVFYPARTTFEFVKAGIRVSRICVFAALICLYFGFRNDTKQYDNADAERQSLLSKKIAPKPSASEDSSTGYGTNAETSQDSNSEEEDSWLEDQRKAAELVKKRLEQDGNWFTYAKGFMVFIPHIWPVHDKILQFRAVLVGLCLLATNALNVLVPNQMGVMVDRLKEHVDGTSDKNVWLPVAIYAALLFASGGAGIGMIRRRLWIPLEQFSYKALSTAAHAHLMSLSSDFHDSKTSSELSQAISGGRSVADLLETVCFQVVPMFIDLTIAFVYLWSLFGPYMGLIMATTMSTYLYVTTKLIARRAEKRRNYITVFRKEWTICHQSLDGWTTAALFNRIPYERDRYSDAVRDHMRSKWTYEISSQATTAAQALIMTLGFLGALWLGVYQVAYGNKSVGKFTTLIVYWSQLQSPLTFFSQMYKNMSYSLMDAERLLELFQLRPTIADSPTAKTMKLGDCAVEFKDVSFDYDPRKPTLKNVSFVVPPGKTVALVGETGGGKSTMLKLVHRLYDVKGGSITIDGQDVRDVTLQSLREKIGVVPQDPMLFNESIMSNIRYARLNATDEDVHAACKAAAIHDKIMSFPDGYNSKVGDRGVKLSGGEKQRVAIARAILKQPQIILLDEATSAVDTETESLIQAGLQVLCENKTTFLVAHRLSTIMRADRILVVMDGQIVEQGSHQELLDRKGKYYDLWSKQIFFKPIKPDDERSRSRSPEKNAKIINDSTPRQQTAEIGRAKSSTGQEELDKSPGQQSVGSKKSASGHKRECSKLKADAPEFVPFGSTIASASKVVGEPNKGLKKKEKEDRKGVGKRLFKKADKRKKNGEDSAGTTMDGAESSFESNEPSSCNNISDAEILDPRPPRPSRRHFAKSEPAGVAPERLSGEETKSSEVTAVSSGEGQGQPSLAVPSIPLRRVSAPSDPPGYHNPRASRFKRTRHWRIRNRAASGSSVTLSSSNVTTSGEGSMDEVGRQAPVSTPAEGVGPQAVVTFAMGS